MSKAAGVQAQNLWVRIGAREVLNDVSFTMPGAGVLAICGPNGSGKSTLLKALAGLVRPAAGAALVNGQDTGQLDPRERARTLAYLPQTRAVAWGLPAIEIAALGLMNASAAEARAAAHAALERVGAIDLARRSFFSLSGGEQARVLLARVLASAAPVLLLDEPIAGLDPEAQLLTLEILRAEAARGATVVVALHDLDLCARFADRVLLLDEGRVFACAPPCEALCPAALAEVFRLDAEWVETPRGHRLDAARRP